MNNKIFLRGSILKKTNVFTPIYIQSFWEYLYLLPSPPLSIETIILLFWTWYHNIFYELFGWMTQVYKPATLTGVPVFKHYSYRLRSWYSLIDLWLCGVTLHVHREVHTHNTNEVCSKNIQTKILTEKRSMWSIIYQNKFK